MQESSLEALSSQNGKSKGKSDDLICPGPYHDIIHTCIM
jgi:hypothetical protein